MPKKNNAWRSKVRRDGGPAHAELKRKAREYMRAARRKHPPACPCYDCLWGVSVQSQHPRPCKVAV